MSVSVRSLLAVCAAAILGSAAVSSAGPEWAAADEGRVARSAPAGSSATENGALPAVIAAVGAARRGEPIPPGLTPSVGRLRGLSARYKPASECIGHDGSSRSRTKICRLGDRSSRKLVILVGDSHAMMWLPALLETAWRDHWAVIPLVRLGCTPGKWTTALGSEACHEWYRWTIRQVERLRPRVVLLGGSIPERQSPWARAAIDGMVATAQAMKPLARVAVIGDPEGLDQSPLECLRSRRPVSMRTCTTTWPASSLAAYDEIARRVTRVGAGFLRTRGFVCFEHQCPAVIGHTIAWVDNNHMSSAYSAKVAGAFRAAFLRLVPPHAR